MVDESKYKRHCSRHTSDTVQAIQEDIEKQEGRKMDTKQVTVEGNQAKCPSRNLCSLSILLCVLYKDNVFVRSSGSFLTLVFSFFFSLQNTEDTRERKGRTQRKKYEINCVHTGCFHCLA